MGLPPISYVNMSSSKFLLLNVEKKLMLFCKVKSSSRNTESSPFILEIHS